MKGGEWLIAATPDAILTPENLSEEHRLIGQMANEFVAKEVVPALDQLEEKNWTLARQLIRRCGELGLLGVDVPETYGGAALDKVSSVVVGEAVGATASFATTFGAQTGLAIVPILCFGTDAQKQKYLPKLLTGEWLGAYCLSESGAGSDALGARARATRQADGSWILNGEKMWITNGGFADVYIVFAKVDGEQFSAFIVERGFPGVSSGKEEHKLGLHGSSTTPVLLSDARVPAENLLGEVGRGHKIAFNVLNYGRFKLAAMSTGGARATIAEAAKYALSRQQFAQPIATFGAIGNKLAEMTIRAYAVESALYRTAGLIDTMIGSNGHDAAAVAAALEEFAIESSMLKVAGSEMVGLAVDENVQIHGGNGFVRDYPAERRYRDARVNRIFEGTNEINRLLVPGMLAKRAVKGGLALIPAAKKLQDELLSPATPGEESQDVLEQAARTATSMKKTALMALGLGMQTYGEKLADEQEALMLISDIIMDAYLADSAVLRARQAATSASAKTQAPLHADTAAVFVHDAGLRCEAATRTLLAAMTSGDTLRTSLAALRRLLKVAPTNTVAARRRIAAAVREKKGYPFS
jgi:alkylation response protein AidB-like acyl-CoA dehydrogenase